MRVLQTVLASAAAVVIVSTAFAQSPDGRVVWREVEERIEAANAEGLRTVAAELDALPESALEPSGRIKFLAMMGDRYAELSMPKQAVEHYQRALAIHHPGQRGEESDGCANMWSVAMDALLCHYLEHNQKQRILPAIEMARNHSEGFTFAVQHHELSIKWKSILGDAEGSARHAMREMPALLSRLPDRPCETELSALISLVDTASDVPSPTRLNWLEDLGAAAEKSIRAGHEPIGHFRNLVNVRRNAVRIVARRTRDPGRVADVIVGASKEAEERLLECVRQLVQMSDAAQGSINRNEPIVLTNDSHEWLKRNSTDFVSTNPTVPLSEAEKKCFARIVGSARVIGLGEMTHGSHKIFRAKDRRS